MEYLLEKYPFRVIPGLPPKNSQVRFNFNSPILCLFVCLFIYLILTFKPLVGASPDSQFYKDVVEDYIDFKSIN